MHASGNPTLGSAPPPDQNNQTLTPLLPLQTRKVMADVLNRYIADREKSKWNGSIQLGKDWVGVCASYVGFSIKNIPNERRTTCTQLNVQATSASDINSILAFLRELGKRANIAYHDAQLADSLFFLALHACRNLIILTIQATEPLKALYDKKISDLLVDFGINELQIQNQRQAKNDVTLLLQRRNEMLWDLALLEHSSAIWTGMDYHLFNPFQTNTMPVSNRPLDPSKPYFLQENLFESYYESHIYPYTRVPLETYLSSDNYFLNPGQENLARSQEMPSSLSVFNQRSIIVPGNDADNAVKQLNPNQTY